MRLQAVGIPVREVLRKAQEDVAPRLGVVRGLRSYECQECNWALDQVIRSIRGLAPDVAVADLNLPSFRLLSTASNDPDSRLFAPDDQLPAVMETLQRAEVLLFATRESLGLPDANVVRLLERLGRIEQPQGVRSLTPRLLLAGKPAGIVICGGPGALQAGYVVANALMALGAVIAQNGVAAWSDANGEVYRDRDFAAHLERLGNNLFDLAKALR